MEKCTANMLEVRSLSTNKCRGEEHGGGILKQENLSTDSHPSPPPCLLSTHLHQAPSCWLVDSLPGCGTPGDQAGMILPEEQTNNKSKERHIQIQGDNWHSGVRWPGRDRHTVQLLSRDLKHGIHPVTSRRAISRAGDSVSRGPGGGMSKRLSGVDESKHAKCGSERWSGGTQSEKVTGKAFGMKTRSTTAVATDGP